MVARSLSIGAILIAGVSLTYSIRTYHRGGARISAAVEKRVQHQVSFMNGAVYDDVISVIVRNSGLATSQIVGMAFEERNRRDPETVEPNGDRLPYALAGNTANEWDVPITAILDPATVDPGTTANVRIHVKLGSGRTVKSNWIEVRDESFGGER
jgi:hypothetical protein